MECRWCRFGLEAGRWGGVRLERRAGAAAEWQCASESARSRSRPNQLSRSLSRPPAAGALDHGITSHSSPVTDQQPVITCRSSSNTSGRPADNSSLHHPAPIFQGSLHHRTPFSLTTDLRPVAGRQAQPIRPGRAPRLLAHSFSCLGFITLSLSPRKPLHLSSFHAPTATFSSTPATSLPAATSSASACAASLPDRTAPSMEARYFCLV